MKNCLTYAFGKWRREGGYLLIRRSLAAHMFGKTSHWHPIYWIPHFLHLSKDGVLSQYVPTPELVELHQANLWKLWLFLWNFEGQIIYDDSEYQIFIKK